MEFKRDFYSWIASSSLFKRRKTKLSDIEDLWHMISDISKAHKICNMSRGCVPSMGGTGYYIYIFHIFPLSATTQNFPLGKV